jgi:photosystem II stability/assembly factor-like uncharacterized protein
MQKVILKIVFLIVLPTIFLRQMDDPGNDYPRSRRTPRPPIIVPPALASNVTESLPVSDIALSGTSEFWAMDVEGESLHHSSNGGEDFQKQLTPIGRDASISFIDSQNGWAFAPGTQVGILWRTEDGGGSWQQVSRFDESHPNLSKTRIKRLKFLNKTDGWLYDDSSVWRSLDGGESWQLAFDVGIGPATQVNHAVFVDEKRAVLATSDGIYATADGGKNWKVEDQTSRFEAISAIGHQIWALNVGNEIIRSADAGKTWKKSAKIDSMASMASIQFINQSEGWAAGVEVSHVLSYAPTTAGRDFWGVLFHTNDGGKTWTQLPAPKDMGFERVVFTNSKSGWLVGHNGLYRTADAGRTWEAFFERRTEVVAQ